ncbi:MAG: MBL fold metallo-hydrolase [Actinomycetota bacterium]
MHVRIWGSRGSIATPGPDTVRYGGNTSCVEVRLADGSLIVLDAGTGARPLGVRLRDAPPPAIHLFLTHLHVDHLEGLGAFAPIWSPDTQLHIWGPRSPVTTLDARIATYFSPPLFPVHLNDVPAHVTFHDAEGEWTIGGARVSAQPILHPGPTVGYRIEEDERVLTYLTDHEPALGTDLETAAPEWISGSSLAFGADVLLHDCQYANEEYEAHVGWGHSTVSQVATFAEKTKVDRLVLFHHDPMHTDDDLDRILEAVRERRGDLADRCDSAAEGMTFEV